MAPSARLGPTAIAFEPIGVTAEEGERLPWRLGDRAGAFEDFLDVALEAVKEDVLNGKRDQVDRRG